MNRQTGIALTCAALAACLAGCVSTKAQLYDKDGKATNVGFPFREPLPYLLVTSEVVLERSGLNEGLLYTYDTKSGFIPVCDKPVTDEQSLAARNACIALRIKLLPEVPNNANPIPGNPTAPKPNPTKRPGDGRISSQAPNPERDSSIALVSQSLGARPATLFAAVKKPKAPAPTPTVNPFNGNDQAPPETQKPDNSKTDTASKDATKSDSGTSQGPLQIVYLPSPCRLFGVTQTNFLSTSKLNLALTNGWQLTTVGVEADSTAVVGKLLDTVGTVVGALKGGGGGGAGGGAKGGGGATAQGAPEDLYARVTIKYLSPGLYPLATCDSNGSITAIKMPGPSGTRVEWALSIAKEKQ